jgi:hypothetical protein
MKKLNFAKSVTAGVLGLTLLSSCSGAMEKMGMHKCSSKNKCSSKEMNKDANSCSSKEMKAKDANSCSSKAMKKEVK